MPLYKYRAVDARGESAEGTMDEPSAARVASILGERDLQVSTIEPVTKRHGLLSITSGLGWHDIEILNEQLLAVTKSRLPLVPALETMAHDVHRPRLRRALKTIREDIEKGATIDQALENRGDAIPYIYRNMIRAGEKSGNLPGVLAIAATHSRRMIDIRNSTHMALAYPMLVLATAILFMGIFLFRLMPHYAESWSDFGSGLPSWTQFWLDVSIFARSYSVQLAITAVVAIVGVPILLKILRRHPLGAFAIDSAKENMPLFGKTFSALSLARFTRSLGVLLSSGAPPIESLDLAAAASGNGALRHHVREATLRIAEGEQIADALSDTGYFSHTFCWLLSTGEQRGETQDTLLSMAETYDREIHRRDRLTEFLLLPILLIVVGAIIATMITAIYLPIFTLGDAISG